MTLPLLLGEIPSYTGRRYYHFPLSGAVGKRLCEFAGIPPQDEGSQYGRFYWSLLDHFDCANAIERYQPKWDAEMARGRVQDLLGEDDTSVVVALGVRAFDALAGAIYGRGYKGHRGTSWFTWKRFKDFHVVMIPHPSTRNLLYNYEATRNQAGVVLRSAMNYAKEETHGTVQ